MAIQIILCLETIKSAASRKLKESAGFRAKKMINGIREESLKCKVEKLHKSNILNVLDEVLEGK